MNINFITNTTVSVKENNQNKKLKIISFCVVLLTLLFVVSAFFLNVVVGRRYIQSKNKEENLIAQLEAPENKKREALYFLTKDRLQKIGAVDKSRLKIGEYFGNIIKINSKIKIERFDLLGRSSKVNLSVEDYGLFDSFLESAEEYGILKDSILVEKTLFQNNRYVISLNFIFK